MIKLPTVQTVAGQLLGTFKRFPLTILCGIVGAVMLSLITRHDWWYYNHDSGLILMYSKIAMCAELGLCITMAASLIAESKGYDIKQRIIIDVIAIGLIVAYYFTIRRYEHFRTEHFTRFGLYVIASHLLVAFAPFTGKGQVNGYWQFNRALFLRFLLSFLYTVVLYGGIALAMWLLDDLLHVTIHGHYYAYAWYFMVGIFNTVFFLAGVPKNIAELDSDTTYLKGLKGFTQFVLLPLVTGYLLILYAYSLRIILIGSLPKGYVSYLVLTFSGIGILSLLLIYPVRNLDENKWIKIFSRWFYWALYPLIVLLGFSIYHRVHEYGVTADRYFIIVLAVWLASIASYFLFSKRENIKVIPISLFIIAVLSSFGPWGAFSISAKSQLGQLEKILTDNKVLANNKIDTTAAKTIPDSSRYRVESIVRYLVATGETDMLQPLTKHNLDSIDNTYSYGRWDNTWGESEVVMNYMGFSGYGNAMNNYANNNYPRITFARQTNSYGSEKYCVDVKGFDYYSRFSDFYHNYFNLPDIDTTQDQVYFMAGVDSFSVVMCKQPSKYAITLKGKTLATFNLNDSLRALRSAYGSTDITYLTIPQSRFNFDVEGDGYFFRLCVDRISADVKDGKFYIAELRTDVLTKKK